MTSRLDLIDLPGGPDRADVPCAVLLPETDPAKALPLCLLLHGGMSGRDMLVRLQEVIAELWSENRLPRMVVATASTGPSSCYLDHPDGSTTWETFIGTHLREELSTRYPLTTDVLLLGLSMGGYGALKIAFANPEGFKAVAAMEPMIEPALRSEDVHPRNRFYAYGSDLPGVLLGPDRGPALFARDNPANRAIRNADRILAAGLPIYLEVGDDDALLFQDGTEFLHRVLWDLGVPHEYRLTAGADHVGPSLVPRIREAFRWLGERIAPSVPGPQSEAERNWSKWLAAGATDVPPSMPLDPGSPVMRDVLRHNVASSRTKAAMTDPTTNRRFGPLPPTQG